MMPWSHLAVGYVAYSLFARIRHRDAPGDLPTLAAVLGSQFSDIVDKPVGYWLQYHDGRSIGHSLFLLVPLCVAVYVVARSRDRHRVGVAFVIGVVTHVLGDLWRPILVRGAFKDPTYLLWPLFPAPEYDTDNFLSHIDNLVGAVRALEYMTPRQVLTSWVALQFAMVAVLFGIWMVDGFPGPRWLWNVLDRKTSRRQS